MNDIINVIETYANGAVNIFKKLVEPYGINSVKWDDEYYFDNEMEEVLACYEHDSILEGDILIHINIPLCIRCIENKWGSAKETIFSTIFHECGHALFNQIDDWFEYLEEDNDIVKYLYDKHFDKFTNSKEEVLVENFAWDFYDGLENDNELWNIWKKCNEIINNENIMNESKNEIERIVEDVILEYRSKYASTDAVWTKLYNNQPIITDDKPDSIKGDDLRKMCRFISNKFGIIVSYEGIESVNNDYEDALTRQVSTVKVNANKYHIFRIHSPLLNGFIPESTREEYTMKQFICGYVGHILHKEFGMSLVRTQNRPSSDETIYDYGMPESVLKRKWKIMEKFQQSYWEPLISRRAASCLGETNTEE